jgi:hypothetical protein
MKLLFLSYGQGMHQHEVVFAVHTIRWHYRFESPPEIVILTDDPDFFLGLCVTVQYVSPQEWKEWSGPHAFNHRRKILALQHLLANSSEPVLLLDGDTWLRCSLTSLESRVGPGRAVMHIREGRIDRVQSSVYASLHSLICEYNSTASAPIPETSWMWNAGVIGMHPADRSILTSVLKLTDELCGMGTLHVLEQFAFSVVLQSSLQLSEASDTIFHYWPPYLHKPFRTQLLALMRQAMLVPESRRSGFLYQHRPRPSMHRQCRVLARSMLEWAGLLHGYCRSSDSLW